MVFLGVGLWGAGLPSWGQAGLKAPVQFTAEQDHQNMMNQLGITQLREGPSGDERAANHANYDEAKANPYPVLPDALQLDGGGRVTTAAQWWSVRRPQIAEAMQREVYGFVPAQVPKVAWAVVASERESVGGIAVMAKQLVGHLDNSVYPLIDVNISMTLVTPADVGHPVPVLMMFRRTGLPAPVQPPQGDVDRIDGALKRLLAEREPELGTVFAQYPGYGLLPAPAPFRFGPPPPEFGVKPGDLPPTMELLKAGWGYALVDPASIQADNGEGLTRGVIGLVNRGQPRTPAQWGALRAWSWGAGRAAGLPGDGPGGGCEARGDRRGFAVWEGGAGDAGVRPAICNGSNRELRRGWGEAEPAELWRGSGDADGRGVLLDGGELHEVWRGGGEVRQQKRERSAGGFA